MNLIIYTDKIYKIKFGPTENCIHLTPAPEQVNTVGVNVFHSALLTVIASL